MWFVSFFSYPLGILLATAGPLAASAVYAVSIGKTLGVILALIPQSISVRLILGVAGALSFGFIFGGGMACIQHLCLRLVLTHARATPWNYARFLNYCTERRLLQRIGGRYRFIHRELLDHFAGSS